MKEKPSNFRDAGFPNQKTFRDALFAMPIAFMVFLMSVGLAIGLLFDALPLLKKIFNKP